MPLTRDETQELYAQIGALAVAFGKDGDEIRSVKSAAFAFPGITSLRVLIGYVRRVLNLRRRGLTTLGIPRRLQPSDGTTTGIRRLIVLRRIVLMAMRDLGSEWVCCYMSTL